MKNILIKYARLIFGLILCASSTVFMLNSNLGLSPWDVFHQGIANLTGITIGQANVVVGVLFVIIAILLGEKLGIATILNMILVGQFIDIIIYMNIIPVAGGIISGVIFMIIGMLVMGMGCYYYISCGLGCGPRDGVMIVLSKLSGKSIKLVRTGMEVVVLALGYFLGGTTGMATFITAIGLGFCMELVFRIARFDASVVEHKPLSKSFSQTEV